MDCELCKMAGCGVACLCKCHQQEDDVCEICGQPPTPNCNNANCDTGDNYDYFSENGQFGVGA